MPLELYYLLDSPPCRSVLMLGKILGIEFDLKPIKLMEQEHLSPEFLKLNPEHTIPTLVDDGFPIWESRAILCYLADKYGKDDSLYPKDLKKRARINQRLYFDAILIERFHVYYQALLAGNNNPELLKILEESIALLDTILAGQKYLTGDSLTIADLPLFINITIYSLGGLDLCKYPNLKRWIDDFQTVPGYDIHQEGFELSRKKMEFLKKKAMATCY